MGKMLYKLSYLKILLVTRKVAYFKIKDNFKISIKVNIMRSYMINAPNNLLYNLGLLNSFSIYTTICVQ